MSFTDTPLYGGAITVDLPSNFADTRSVLKFPQPQFKSLHIPHRQCTSQLTCQQYSQIREVPDHQEVYLDTNGYSSIVVEILEYQEKGSDEEALQYHFADLIDEEDSTNILEQGRAVMAKLRYVHCNSNRETRTCAFIPSHQPISVLSIASIY